MNNNTILLGIIAVVALFVAGCVSQGSNTQASAVPTLSAVADAQVNAASAEVDKALLEMDNVTSELSDINSQDVNSSVTDKLG